MMTGTSWISELRAEVFRRVVTVLVVLSCAIMPGTARAQISKEDLLGLGLRLLLEGQRRAEQASNTGTRQNPGSGAAQPRNAARSEMVAQAQQKLNDLGYDAGSVDGQMGPRTRTAIAAFQRDHGVQPTGEVSPVLIEQLAQGAVTGADRLQAQGDTAAYGSEAIPPTNRAEATPDTLIKMALMSDQSYFRSVADAAGINFIRATGTDDQCRAIYNAQRQDEFARRNVIALAAVMFNQIMDSLPERSFQAVLPVEATYSLGDYDFERKGYPIRPNTGSPSILMPATIPILSGPRPTFCAPAWGYGNQFADPRSEYDTRFESLKAEHDGLPGIDFLPLDEETAKVFADRSKTILLSARLVVEPRSQGRGPLPGRYVSLDAFLPDGRQLLYSWSLPTAPPEAAAGTLQPLSADFLARIIVPVIEPQIADQEVDSASVQYFRRFSGEIELGNTPPGSPLPIDVIRGKLPEVIAEVNRPALRAYLREVTTTLPVSVEITNRSAISYKEGIGLQFNAYQNDLPVGPSTEQDNELVLSDRGLQLSTQLIPLASWSAYVQSGYRPSVLAISHPRMAVEFDRVVTLNPVPAHIEEAAARGLVGNTGAMQRDNVMLHWQIDIDEVRLTNDLVILSARLRNLTYRWESDGTVLASFDADDFPTMAEVQQRIEDSLPKIAGAENVLVPPPESRWGAEMSDLLQLRYLPETVDETFLQRMMFARYEDERQTPANTSPPWGNFFREFSGTVPFERLQEFRAWSEARAANLPETLKLVVPLRPTGAFNAQSEAALPRYWGCAENLAPVDGKQQDERQVILAKQCAYLTEAWKQPEEFLYHSPTGKGFGAQGLRTGCDGSDPYCSAIYYANIALKTADRPTPLDIVRLDRFPVINAATIQNREKIVLEIVVTPTGLAVQDTLPDSIWKTAQDTAFAFRTQYEKNPGFQLQHNSTGGVPVFVYEATTQSARLVDQVTGETVLDLTLATPVAPAPEMLEMAPSGTDRDILGIRLGTSFDEADALIRAHMDVGKVFFADRSKQLGTISGKIQPYSSGRLYTSATGNEVIALYDEPPSASGTVVGMWRLLRLPKGAIDASSLKVSITDRYGEPTEIQETSLPFMQKGLMFSWIENDHPRCAAINTTSIMEPWQDESGTALQLPFMIPNFYVPNDSLIGFVDVKDEPLPTGSFCPAMLAVSYASPDGKNYAEPAGEEIITWLTNDRDYARLFFQSRETPITQSATPASGKADIKF